MHGFWGTSILAKQKQREGGRSLGEMSVSSVTGWRD